MATMYKANLICSKNHDHKIKKYIWSDDESQILCEEEGCKGIMNEEFDDEPKENFNIGGKYKSRPKKDARQRSLNDFKKNIFPNLDPPDKNYFRKKHKFKD